MENKNLNEAINASNELFHEFILNGYPRNDAYKEIATIFFLAAATKNNNLPLSLKEESKAKKYFKGTSLIENISTDQVLQNIVIYNEQADDLYKKLILLSDDEIKELFEYTQNKKYEEIGKYDDFSSTTKDISKLAIHLCNNSKKGSFVDICSGDGTMLVEASKAGYKNLAGYEINLTNALLSKMRGIINQTKFNIKECDVLQEKMNKEYDCAFTQPPFALRTFQATKKDNDETLKYSESDRVIKADWHFVLKAINATKKGGKTIALVTAGALYNTPDVFYRKQIIENKKLETVILLPTGIIPSTNISTDLLVFSDNNTSIKFIDASECFIKIKGYEKKLDVEKIVDLLKQKKAEKVATVSYKDIQFDNYPLDVYRYLNMDMSCQIDNLEALKDFAEVIPGFQYTTRNVQELEPGVGNVSVVKITNLINEKIDYSNLVSIDIDKTKIEKYLLRENDILVATKGTALKFALVEGVADKKLIPHSNMTIIRCSKKLEPLYLISFLKSQIGATMFKRIQTGSIIMNITSKAIENFQIPIVDDDTQKVIANRYKIINKEILKIKEKLTAAEKKLETLWEDEVAE